MSVNARMREPRPPGPWVDTVRCEGCGETFADFRTSYDYSDAVEAVRAANGGWRGGGGFRSRGPVLWALHCLKLREWYQEHALDRVTSSRGATVTSPSRPPTDPGRPRSRPHPVRRLHGRPGSLPRPISACGVTP